MLFSSVFSFVVLAASSVSAHGTVFKMIADGKTYKGPVAGGAAISSPIRQISTTSPWKEPNGPGITCGRNAKNAKLVAPVTAGSTIQLGWEDHPGTNWQHDMGPLIDYLAEVPAGQTADKFDASKGKFFKIAQVGQTGKTWAQAALMKGAMHKVTIPKGLKNGDYILRHEIVALHLANKKGGAEFYTSCIQLRVTGGTGTANTKVSPTVTFPGGYNANDAGIFTPKIFDGGFKYQFPGPAIAKFSTGGAAAAGNLGGSNASNNTIIDDTTTTASSSSAAPTSTGKTHCRRGQAAVHGWNSRMEKRYLGASAE